MATAETSAETSAPKVKTEPVKEAPKTRELNYLMVQHMGYAPETRAHRHARPGQRKQRFLLEDGRRIIDRGEHFDEVVFEDVLKNHEILLNGVRTGAIRVCRPDNLEPLTLAQLGDLCVQLAKDKKQHLKIDKTLLEPLVGSDLTDEKVWTEKPKATQPPVDNEHVAPGAEKFSPETIEANKAPVPAAQVEGAELSKPGEGTELLDDEGKEAEPEPDVKEAPKTEPKTAEPEKKDPKHLDKKKGRR